VSGIAVQHADHGYSRCGNLGVDIFTDGTNVYDSKGGDFERLGSV